MRRLGYLDLPDGTVWSNRFTWTKMSQIQQRTLTGKLIFDVRYLKNGQAITLEFPEDSAWLSFEQVSILSRWSQNSYSIVFCWDTFQSAVVFDTTQQNEFSPIANYMESEKDFFFGKIHLITL